MDRSNEEKEFISEEENRWLFFPKSYKNNPWVIKIIPLLKEVLEKYRRGDLSLGLLGKSFSSLSCILHQKVDYILSPPKKSEEKVVVKRVERTEEVEGIFPAIRVPGRKPVLVDFISAFLEMETKDRKKYIERLKVLEEYIKSTVGFDEQRVNIERLLIEVYNKITNLYRKGTKEEISFKEIVSRHDKLEIIRTLLCLLYLEVEGKINIYQKEDGEIFVKPVY